MTCHKCIFVSQNLWYKVFIELKKQCYPFTYIKRSCTSSYTLKHVDLVISLTGCSTRQVALALSKNMYLQEESENYIHEKVLTLKELGFEGGALLRGLGALKFHPVTFRNRKECLEEAGFIPSMITPDTVAKYIQLSKVPLDVLKQKKYIEVDTDVSDSMLSYLECPLPESLPLLKNKDNTFISVKWHVLRAYLRWKLDLDLHEAERTGRLFFRLKNKSIRNLIQTIDVAHNIIGLSYEKIRNNLFLLHTDPYNSLEILKSFPKIGEMDIKTALCNHPKIMASQVKNLIQIRQHLEDFGISDAAISKCLDIFTLNSDCVKFRLDEIKRNKILRTFLCHPRILELVFYQHKALQRVVSLEAHGRLPVSLNLISSGEKRFLKFYEFGGDVGRGTDIIHIVSGELSVDKTELRNKLSFHPYWAFLPVVQVNYNLQALLHLGFSVEEIFQHVIIILYPKDMVKKVLDSLESEPGLEMCRGPDGCIKREFLLELVMYFLEKQTNFTGEAVWTSEYPPTNPHPE